MGASESVELAATPVPRGTMKGFDEGLGAFVEILLQRGDTTQLALLLNIRGPPLLLQLCSNSDKFAAVCNTDYRFWLYAARFFGPAEDIPGTATVAYWQEFIALSYLSQLIVSPIGRVDAMPIFFVGMLGRMARDGARTAASRFGVANSKILLEQELQGPLDLGDGGVFVRSAFTFILFDSRDDIDQVLGGQDTETRRNMLVTIGRLAEEATLWGSNSNLLQLALMLSQYEGMGSTIAKLMRSPEVEQLQPSEVEAVFRGTARMTMPKKVRREYNGLIFNSRQFQMLSKSVAAEFIRRIGNSSRARVQVEQLNFDI